MRTLRCIARDRLGDHRGAAEDAERAIAESPHRWEGHHNLGWARYKLGDLVAAERAQRKAVELQDFTGHKEWRARCNLASTLAAQGRLEEATRWLDEAFDLGIALQRDVELDPLLVQSPTYAARARRVP
jgi:Flp pilus assembly protein TadD